MSDMSPARKQSPKPGQEKPAAGPGKRGGKQKGKGLDDRPVLEPNAAGIDIGAREIFVAVPPDRAEDPVQVFSTFTEDLEKMAQWLVSCGVTTVAMESTGVYWIPLYDVFGETWGKAVFGGCAWHEERTRPAHRLARMPVAAISAFGGITARRIPAGRRRLRGAVVDAASQRSGADD
jgi:hypothetical protein